VLLADGGGWQQESTFGDLETEAAAADAVYSFFCAACHARQPIMAASVTPCATTRARMNKLRWRRWPSAKD
jgi:hypothetical protein